MLLFLLPHVTITNKHLVMDWLSTNLSFPAHVHAKKGERGEEDIPGHVVTSLVK